MSRISALRRASLTSVNRMYDQGIHLSQAEFLRFRTAAQYAAERKESLIILPCHKSHIDYLTISWLFFRLGLSLPHIVAGGTSFSHGKVRPCRTDRFGLM